MLHVTDASNTVGNLSTELSVSTLSPKIREFWEINGEVESTLAGLCEYHKRKKKLEAAPTHGLNGYHEYLTNVASLDLGSVNASLDRLQRLQTVLRYAAHGRAQDRRALESIDGIDFDDRRILIKDWFIQESHDHAAIYLDAVKRA